MKKVLFILFLFPLFASAVCDTVTNLTISSISYNSGKATFTAATGANNYSWSIYTYPANVYTGISGTTTNTAINFTGLNPSTQYVFKIQTNCIGSSSGNATKVFTTTANSVVCTPMTAECYSYKFLRADSMLHVSIGDTVIGRATNRAGAIVFKSADSIYYGYNGRKWQPLGGNVTSLVTDINKKVDTIWISGDTLYYTKNSVQYAYFITQQPNDTNYAKLNYDNSFTGVNEFAGSTIFNNEVAFFRGDAGGTFFIHYEDSAYAAGEALLTFPKVRANGSDKVAYQRYVDSVAASLGSGTVTSVSRTNGLGITASVANPTTTPDITIAVDTSSTSILSRQRAASTYQGVLNGTGAVYSTAGTITYKKFIDSTEKTYSSTITFTGGTAPSGTTNHTYEWSQNGRVVTFRLNMSYGTAGSGNTAVAFDIPSDMPTPTLITGYQTSNDDRMIVFPCNGGNTKTLVNPLSAGLVYNGGTPRIKAFFASQNMQYLQITGSYFTNN